MSTVLKSGSLSLLEPSGPVHACNGIALPLPYREIRFNKQLSRVRIPGEILSCVLSNFCRDMCEICALLGYDATRCGNYLPTFRENLLVRSSRVKKSISRTCNMGPIGCPETWVRNYHSALRNVLEERRSEFIISKHVQSSWATTLTTHAHQAPRLRRTGSTPLPLARRGNFAFIDAFAISRKLLSASLCLPVCLPAWKVAAPQLTDFHETRYKTIFRENSTFIIRV